MTGICNCEKASGRRYLEQDWKAVDNRDTHPVKWAPDLIMIY
jgi:hypothetical protein